MTQPKWVVLEATPRDDYTIDLQFADGTRGVLMYRAYLRVDARCLQFADGTSGVLMVAT